LYFYGFIGQSGKLKIFLYPLSSTGVFCIFPPIGIPENEAGDGTLLPFPLIRCQSGNCSISSQNNPDFFLSGGEMSDYVQTMTGYRHVFLPSLSMIFSPDMHFKSFLFSGTVIRMKQGKAFFSGIDDT
jgi:hypothetical protein